MWSRKTFNDSHNYSRFLSDPRLARRAAERTGARRRHAHGVRPAAPARHRPAGRWRVLSLRHQSSRHERDDRLFRAADVRHADRARPQRSRGVRRAVADEVPQQGRGRRRGAARSRAGSTCSRTASAPRPWPADRSSSPSPARTCCRAPCSTSITATSPSSRWRSPTCSRSRSRACRAPVCRWTRRTSRQPRRRPARRRGHQSRARRVRPARRPCISASVTTAARRSRRASGSSCSASSTACRTNHVVLELAHRPVDDLDALKDVDKRISLGLGVIDVKVNHVETPDEVAAPHRAHREDRRPRTPRLGSSRLRFLDAEAHRGRPQNGLAGGWPRLVRGTSVSPRQLTDHPSINHPSYFLQSSFLPGGRSTLLLVVSNGRCATVRSRHREQSHAPIDKRRRHPPVLAGLRTSAATRSSSRAAAPCMPSASDTRRRAPDRRHTASPTRRAIAQRRRRVADGRIQEQDDPGTRSRQARRVAAPTSFPSCGR